MNDLGRAIILRRQKKSFIQRTLQCSMSYPISYCLVSKAAFGDDAAYQTLVEAMRCNIKCGHYTQFPCNCDPKCTEVTQEFGEALNKRLAEDLNDVVMDPGYSGPSGTEGPTGIE